MNSNQFTGYLDMIQGKKSLMQVIEEEVDVFFAGDISAQEAAKRIQKPRQSGFGE